MVFVCINRKEKKSEISKSGTKGKKYKSIEKLLMNQFQMTAGHISLQTCDYILGACQPAHFNSYLQYPILWLHDSQFSTYFASFWSLFLISGH